MRKHPHITSTRAFEQLPPHPLTASSQGQPGIRQASPGSDVFYCDDLPRVARAPPPLLKTPSPPQGSRGKAVDLPAFVTGGVTSGGGAPPEQLLIQWEVQSDQGTGQVLLLARAAHCMRAVAEARAARRSVAGSPEFEVRGGGRFFWAAAAGQGALFLGSGC